MLSEQRITELKELLPWVYFVGVGYWPSPSEESFALGVEPPKNVYRQDLFSSAVIDTEVSRLKPFASVGWKLIFFIVTKEPGRTQVPREEAEWLLDNRAHY